MSAAWKYGELAQRRPLCIAKVVSQGPIVSRMLSSKLELFGGVTE